MRENVQKIRSEENSQDTDTDDSLDDNSDCHWERYTVLPETCIFFSWLEFWHFNVVAHQVDKMTFLEVGGK